MELLDVGTLGIRRLDSGCLDDRNTAMADTVTRSHLLVELLNGTVEGDITVLLVGVVDTGTGVVTNPDAKVLDSGGILLEDFVDG